MANLFLSSTEKTKLNMTLSLMETLNGNKVYNSICCTSHDDCKRWDCSISCYCANSLL